MKLICENYLQIDLLMYNENKLISDEKTII